ncbi:MAG TPA: tetratricopeptide repeat protein [Thiotrichaceae bacterium]|nr:tetratricopeptide repeat protein [Thiotrichaceae bacterium]
MNINILKYIHKKWVKKMSPDAEQNLVDKAQTTTNGWQKSWEKVQSSFSITVKVFFAVLFMLIVSHAIYELFRYDIVINPFDMPFNLSRQGYTGTVVAYRLQDDMAAVREEIERSSMLESAKVAAVQFTELQKRPEIDVPSLGLSLKSTISQLRKILRLAPRRISGDMVVRGDKLYLTLRISGKLAFETYGDDVKNPEPLIKTAAKYVLEIFEPLTFGLNYCLNDKIPDLEKLIQNLKQFTRRKERAVVLTLEGCLLKKQKDYQGALETLAQASKLDSQNPIIFNLKGDTLQDSGAYEEALLAYKKAVKLDPKNGGIYTQWARTLIKMGKTEEAFLKYQEASKNDPDNPWVYTDWGYQLAEVLENFPAADEKFEQAIIKDPTYALAYALWGDVLLKYLDNYAKANEKYAKAVELDPNIAWIYGNWGVALVGLKNDQKALEQFAISLKLKSNNYWVYRELRDALKRLKQPQLFVKYEALALNHASYYNAWGDVLEQFKQYEAALIQYQKAAEISPTEGLYYLKWGNVLHDLGQYEAALVKYEQALNSNASYSTRAWIYSGWGDVLVKLKQYEAALIKYEEAVTLDPEILTRFDKNVVEAIQELNKPDYFAQYEPLVNKSTDNTFKGRFYYTYALVLDALKRYPESITQYQKATEFDLGDASFYGNWGNALLHAGHSEQAIEKYKMAQNKNPDINWITANWGVALADLKRYKEAITQYQIAVNLKPEGWIYYKWGDALFQLKQYEQAIVQYETALEWEPNKRLYYYAWGKALSELNRYEEAISQFDKALEIEPTHIWSRIRLSYALIQLKQPETVLTQCQTILASQQVSQTAKAAAYALCGLAEVGLNKPESAIENCQKALEVSATEDWAYWCLGEAKRQLNQAEAAVIEYEKAVALKPENAFYYSQLGQTLTELKQYEAALVQYQQAVKLDQNGEIGKQAELHIKEMTNKIREQVQIHIQKLKDKMNPN